MGYPRQTSPRLGRHTPSADFRLQSLTLAGIRGVERRQRIGRATSHRGAGLAPVRLRGIQADERHDRPVRPAVNQTWAEDDAERCGGERWGWRLHSNQGGRMLADGEEMAGTEFGDKSEVFRPVRVKLTPPHF